MNNKDSDIPDLCVSTIRSINIQTPDDWYIKERTWHPKAVQEGLKKFIDELMVEWGLKEKWGRIEKLKIPQNMNRFSNNHKNFKN